LILNALPGANRASYQRPQVRIAHTSVGQGSLKIVLARIRRW